MEEEMRKDSSKKRAFGKLLRMQLVGGVMAVMMPLAVIADDGPTPSANKKPILEAVIRTTASANVPQVTMASSRGERSPHRMPAGQAHLKLNFCLPAGTR
jgi:hypothetical protein